MPNVPTNKKVYTKASIKKSLIDKFLFFSTRQKIKVCRVARTSKRRNSD